MLIFEFINVFIETVIILFYCGNIFEVKHSLSNGAKIAIIFGLLGILTALVLSYRMLCMKES